jgi:uncharacterized membrane protein SpoIIM required for sporulation
MEDYIRQRKKEWRDLEELVKRAKKKGRGLRGMSADEISRLDVLYRRTTIHLAQVATRIKDPALLKYLNDLTAAAHSVIYLPSRRSALNHAWVFIRDGFAKAVARTWRYHAVAALLLLLGAFLGYFAAMQDPTASYALMPAGEFRQPGATPEQLQEILRHGRDTQGGTKFFFATFLFSHNLKVSFFALATGVLAGIPTILLITYNGMILGAFTATHHMSGIYAEYWAWILPHGITELSAVVLCAGVGLQLGHAVVSPGLKSRSESLLEAGKEAGRIVLGIGLMLVFAAVVESYLRQSRLSIPGRLAFAGATFLLWAGYFVRGALLQRLENMEAASEKAKAAT